MARTDMHRHEAIDRLTAQHSERTADTTATLWGPMAKHIIAIVGVNGFDSLYARSVFLTQSQYPWLNTSTLAPMADDRFAALKASLERTTPELAHAANRLLLTIFTDTLASLIGEPLTARILVSAWGKEALQPNSKDPKNE